MTTPRVSVCIVTYNHERYIHDCVMTVIAQAQDVSLEILIGDDQSADRTGDVVRSLAAQFPELIHYFRHETRLGPGGNYQFLIGRARGEYIAHLDGDDYWLPGKLARQMALLDSDSRMSACYTNALCVDDSGGAIGVFNNHQPSFFDLNYLLREGNFLNHSSMLYRSRLRQKICEWDPSFLDYKIHILLASNGVLGYLNFLGVTYRVGSNTSMIVLQGESVRDLYWQAIDGASSDQLRPDSKLRASADFLRRVFFRAIRVRSLALLNKWWAIVHGLHRHNKLRLVFITFKSIVTVAFREISSRIAGRVGGTRLRVIYWR